MNTLNQNFSQVGSAILQNEFFQYRFPESVATLLIKLKTSFNLVFMECPPILPILKSGNSRNSHGITTSGIYYPMTIFFHNKGEFTLFSYGHDFNIIPSYTNDKNIEGYFSCGKGLGLECRDTYILYVQIKKSADHLLRSVTEDIDRCSLLFCKSNLNGAKWFKISAILREL